MMWQLGYRKTVMAAGRERTTRHLFTSYLGIDYSGAQTAESGLRGLRVFVADTKREPVEVDPPPGRSLYWTRRGLANWLVERLAGDGPTIVGIDHGLSFPWQYFETHHLEPDWPAFLADFRRHWPTDDQNVSVDLIRRGQIGAGRDRAGSSRWRRLTERRVGAKSVFHFDVPGSVAKSTHAGLPWLSYLREQLGGGLHFWPFDGWEVPAGRSVMAEAYPSLWNRDYQRVELTPDQHDAWVVAKWLREADRDGSLSGFFQPALTEAEAARARIEGWILGVR
jgi:hypothetical protein